MTDPFGKEAHDREAPEHSGIDGHECYGGWDGLYICKDCEEYKHCQCVDAGDDELSGIERLALCIDGDSISFRDAPADVVAELKRRTQKSLEFWRRAKKAEEPAKFLFRLINERRASIVSSADCSQFEIAQAAACGRFYVNEDGFGFVLRPGFGPPST